MFDKSTGVLAAGRVNGLKKRQPFDDSRFFISRYESFVNLLRYTLKTFSLKVDHFNAISEISRLWFG